MSLSSWWGSSNQQHPLSPTSEYSSSDSLRPSSDDDYNNEIPSVSTNTASELSIHQKPHEKDSTDLLKPEINTKDALEPTRQEIPNSIDIPQQPSSPRSGRRFSERPQSWFGFANNAREDIRVSTSFETEKSTASLVSSLNSSRLQDKGFMRTISDENLTTSPSTFTKSDLPVTGPLTPSSSTPVSLSISSAISNIDFTKPLPIDRIKTVSNRRSSASLYGASTISSSKNVGSEMRRSRSGSNASTRSVKGLPFVASLNRPPKAAPKVAETNGIVVTAIATPAKNPSPDKDHLSAKESLTKRMERERSRERDDAMSIKSRRRSQSPDSDGGGKKPPSPTTISATTSSISVSKKDLSLTTSDQAVEQSSHPITPSPPKSGGGTDQKGWSSWLGGRSSTPNTNETLSPPLSEKLEVNLDDQPKLLLSPTKAEKKLSVSSATNESSDEATSNSTSVPLEKTASEEAFMKAVDSSKSSWLGFLSSGTSRYDPSKQGGDALGPKLTVETELQKKTQEMSNKLDENEEEPIIGVVSRSRKDRATVASLLEPPASAASNSPRSSSKSPPTPPPPAVPNVVLPTFESQFPNHVRFPNSKIEPTIPLPPIVETPDNGSIVYRAVNAVKWIWNSVAAEEEQVVNKLENMLAGGWNREIDPATMKIVILGVHGWFPMKLVRSVIGEPTGTSTKFCEQMSKAVKSYFNNSHGIEIHDQQITLIPLEGEGKVEDRVQKLYENLLLHPTWCSQLSSADVIFVATHSQGTPVSTILLRRLLEEGHIHTRRQRVCMLAMAGISHGPFPYLKGNLIVKYFEAHAARELFEFMDSNSEIASKYHDCLSYVLGARVKLVLVGSMQDQVVPLYSAIMAGATHPNILRSIFIDGNIYAENDFLINLIIFALRLRNAGVTDHGLIEHLSEVLAGNLYSLEGGHSTIYEELKVYEIAAQYIFGKIGDGFAVSSVSDAVDMSSNSTQTIKKEKKNDITQLPPLAQAILDPFVARPRQNPFYLPWAMRGIFDDQRVVGDEILNGELERLMKMFNEWEPTSAKMKEIKWRLEPLSLPSKARL